MFFFLSLVRCGKDEERCIDGKLVWGSCSCLIARVNSLWNDYSLEVEKFSYRAILSVFCRTRFNYSPQLT